MRAVIGMFVATLCCAMFLTSPALADYPAKPVKLLVGFKAGGAIDTSARLLAKKAGQILGQPIIIQNKPGGGGAVAAMTLKNAKPDGYTLAYGVVLPYSHWPALGKVKYKADDFNYIAAVVEMPASFVASSKAPYKTWKEAVAAARKSPKGLSMAVITPWEKVALRYIGKKEGVRFRPMPTKGGAAVMTQVMGGHADLGFAGGVVNSYVRAGKMVHLVNCGPEPLTGFPKVPNLIDEGYDISLENYLMFAAPKGVKADIVAKLAEAFKQASQSKEFKDLALKMDMPPVFLGPEKLDAKVSELAIGFKKMLEYTKK